MPNTIKLVFDNVAWQASGDIGDNSIFYKPAIIVSNYIDRDGRMLADVVFLDSIRISRGHLIESMKDYA